MHFVIYVILFIISLTFGYISNPENPLEFGTFWIACMALYGFCSLNFED